MTEAKLRIHNTLTRRKEDFIPLDENNVRMYTCGPTVYNYIHIGNARMMVVFDVAQRVLEHLYPGKVTHAQNITDVDDKIIQRARDEGKSVDEIVQTYTKAYMADRKALGCLELTLQPKCRDHIPQMISITETLVKKGYAYEAEGNVLFNVPKWNEYGKLSRRSRDELVAGARVEVAPYKKDPADFILWKPSKDDEPVETRFDSPWGQGRPGWHIECSAMAKESLGETFDIHGGGLDLIFPHHENEIAQSRCAFGTSEMARYWMHNGFLNMGDEKMSKSLGNSVFPHELIKKGWKGEVIRLALLSAHYRQPLNYSDQLLEQSESSLNHWYFVLKQENQYNLGSINIIDISVENEKLKSVIDEFNKALVDDFNTPEAIRYLHRLAYMAGNYDSGKIDQFELMNTVRQEFKKCANLLGLLLVEFDEWHSLKPNDLISEEDINLLIQIRDAAKQSKDYTKADAIRDKLLAQGIALDDGPDGTKPRNVRK